MTVRCVQENVASLNRARNRGVEEARAEILALLDDDVWVEEDWLKGLLTPLRRHPADLLAGRVSLLWESSPPPNWVSARVERLLSRLEHGDQIRELKQASQVVGANFAFRREVFERLGGFLPGLDRSGADLLSGGDTEFVSRALASGFRMFYAPEMAVKHRIPPYRTSLTYLCELARSRGRTRVALAASRGAFTPITLLRRGLAQVVVGGLGELKAQAGGNRTRAVESRLIRMRGEGTLIGILNVLRRRRFPPTASD